jgi:hypothetical protein
VLKLPCPPCLDPKTIDTTTFHTLHYAGRRVREREFFKAVLIGYSLPAGPHLVLVEDWKKSLLPKKRVYTYLEPLRRGTHFYARTGETFDINLDASRCAVWPRRGLVPVPAKTTEADVKLACEKTQEILHTRMAHGRVKPEQLETVTRHVILYLTGHFPILVTTEHPILGRVIELGG